jgi:hypothetical protein
VSRADDAGGTQFRHPQVRVNAAAPDPLPAARSASIPAEWFAIPTFRPHQRGRKGGGGIEEKEWLSQRKLLNRA